MKLLCEVLDRVEVLTEANTEGKKSYFIEGVFMQAGIKNKNGRVYPPAVMEAEVARYIKEKIELKCAYGELDHPPTPKINMPLVSHMITELKRDGNNYIGRAKIVDTPMGNIARALIEEGARLGVSSRGVGQLTENRKLGVMEVSQFRLSTAADIVSDPSAPAAWVAGIMEGVDVFMDPRTGDWVVQEMIDNQRNRMKKMSTKQIEENLAGLFEQYLETLKNIK
jgi:hypothetical protein